MNDFRREDPPQAKNTKASVRYAAELEKVRAEPDEWFRLCSCPTQVKASQVAASLRAQCPGFEFRGARGAVYARFIGGVAV